MTPPNEATKQVATRVPAEVWELLQVGLLVEEVETMQDLLRPVIEEYAKRLAEQPEVQAIRDNVDNYRARKRGVRKLRPRQSGTRASQSARDDDS